MSGSLPPPSDVLEWLPMTSRDRVLLSLNHSEPDRLPIFAPNVMRTRTPYDPQVTRFLDDFEFDALKSLGGVIGHPSERRETDPDIFVDGYGCRFEYRGVGGAYCVDSPLARAQTIADVEAFDWPDPETACTIDPDAGAKALSASATPDFARAVSVPPVFHYCHYLRGFEQWMVDVRENPGILEAITDHVMQIHSTLLMRLLEQVGDHTDIVTAGDDFGWSAAPYISQKDFRELIKPYYRDLIGRIKNRFPRIKFYLHSHGQIMDFVPDLIDCGVDVLNPVLPLDNMDPVRLKREFGKQLCFHGGVDVEHVLPFGSVLDVREHCRKVIDTFAPNGGYWFKAQVISPVIPPENLVAAYECARMG